MKVSRVACTVGLLFFMWESLPNAVLAQDAADNSPPAVVDRPLEPFTWPSLTERYDQFNCSVQVMNGYYTSLHRFGPRPDLDFQFSPIDVRLGVTLYDPWPVLAWFASNTELLLDLTTAPVVRGPGSYVVGPSLMVHGNLVPPDSLLVPYLQGGMGIVWNDGYRDQSQRNLGQDQEFYLTAALGVHYHINPWWSLDVEAAYQHISNAGLSVRNLGINMVGGSVGFTYTFGVGSHR